MFSAVFVDWRVDVRHDQNDADNEAAQRQRDQVTKYDAGVVVLEAVKAEHGLSPPSMMSGDQMHGASFEQAIVGHEPDVENGADERLVEGNCHAEDQGRDHRGDGVRIGSGLGTHAREGDDEADDRADQANQDDGVGEMPDGAQTDAELHLQPFGHEGTALAVLARDGASIDVDPRGRVFGVVLELVQIVTELDDPISAQREPDQEHADVELDHVIAVRGDHAVQPAVRPHRSDQRDPHQVEHPEAQHQEIAQAGGVRFRERREPVGQGPAPWRRRSCA